LFSIALSKAIRSNVLRRLGACDDPVVLAQRKANAAWFVGVMILMVYAMTLFLLPPAA
jgi:hypothetical protein